jgi:hypothetical protein
MTFNDDDLKRLKVKHEGDEEPWYLEALLARLEASERKNKAADAVDLDF